jgi:GntR family transcriptional regulator / MocR family aminotransferase
MHLQEKVFRLLKKQILDGTLNAGTRLLPSRVLAKELGVSRNTVLIALERLEAEGFVQARKGSGCYVNADVQLPEGAALPSVSVPRVGFVPYRTDIVDFRSGLPELSSFPVKRWGKLFKEVMDEITPADLGYGPPEGHSLLRREIAAYLNTYRGVRCDADQILITSGTTQAVGIAGSLLLTNSKNKAMVLEDPITVDIRRILQRLGARILFVPVDNAGLCTEALPEDVRPRGIYITPSHQFPLGTVLSAERRIRLIDYAEARDAYIIEDDYDSEYRYDGHPISAVQGLYPERVVYIGTFSKTLSPAIRIGYLVLPPPLIHAARDIKWLTDLHNSVFDQLVLARFISRGHYYRHLLKMKKIYRSKRDFLIANLKTQLGDRIEILGENAGLHLCVRFAGISFTPKRTAALEKSGVRVYPVAEHALDKDKYADTILLGFGMLSREKMSEGVALLSKFLRAPVHRGF